MSTSSSACSASRVIDSDKLLYSIPASFRGGFSGDEQIDVDVVYQYMLPHFVSKGIRLIAINFPGHGFVECE
ncbi:hypothetical protein WR25_08346 [Diploscapter pachys]|uniref:Uncharacterized protein n=1 Tax=Diploscapter pachys TaxID=2018661 RepID=A0A2A2JTL8_9BILA|nr:hypothetical protein WR25_08346 [Diploscapter pachys]